MNNMNYTMGRFNDTFRFTFGFLIKSDANTEQTSFDALNNPYVQLLSGEYFKNDDR